MGDPNQLQFARDIPSLEGPFLEIGSRDYGNTSSFRENFMEQGEYVGIDMLEGKGVDIVLDLTADFEHVDKVLNGQRFGTIFSFSVMEHCTQPFVMAENMPKLLKLGGHIVLSVPFAWGFHGYPSDYWRFTHEGVRILFKCLDFDDQYCRAIMPHISEYQELDGNEGQVAFSYSFYKKRGHRIRGIFAKLLKTIRPTGILNWMIGHPYLMAPTNVMMVGRKNSNN